ncbi:eIF-2-alpha kinase GCN2-like [Watersipora subatra]|uniref:eIF-2-alpha kinase GCN2-like n=1 Tax=Watersipora subatra TaxID=2589382 RepID=UPI00355B2F68
MATFEEKKILQEDELQAITAIYHDVVDLRENDVWKVNRPPEVLVECSPQSSDSTGAAGENYVSLKLKITLARLYPDECPSLEVLEPVGLSDKQIQELKCKLKDLSNQLLGQEMMFELVACTQSFLYANNKPPPKSFYDQMISNNQREVEERNRQAEEHMKLRQIEEELEIEAELEKQQNEIKEENRRRRQAKKFSESEERQAGASNDTRYPSKSPRRHNDSSSSNESFAVRNSLAKNVSPCPVDHSSTKDLSFTKGNYKIIRGQCLCHDTAGSTLFSAMDKETGNLLCLRHWVFDFSKSRVDKADNLAKCRKMLIGTEQDLAKLIKLQDDSLINYLSMHMATESARIFVTVLTEPRKGITLSEFISLPCKIDLQSITMISLQVVQSIVYLHSKQIVHKDIKPTVVYIDKSSVRLADFSLYRRLNEIHHATVTGNLDSAASLVKRGQKEDVFRLGMTILFMVSRQFDEDERLPTIPPDTDKDLKNFLSQCFIADEKTRWSATQLAEHQFLKVKESATRLDSKSAQDEEKGVSDDETDQDSHLEAIIPRDSSGASRLAQEFLLLGIIGEGGFGQVLKVRNKLDRCLYAIKRITLNPRSKLLNKRITREVKLLSRLNHENVVRYYNSWLETGDELVGSTETGTSDETATTHSTKPQNSVFFSDNIEVNAPAKVEESVVWSTASSEHSVESSDFSSEDDSSDVGNFFGQSFGLNLSSESDDVVFDYGISCQSERRDDDSHDTKVQKVVSRSSSPLLRNQFMYIQMEYCEKNTLRQAIDAGLHKNCERVWRLFREIIEGLVHIHDQGMIHRDLKPVNIFLDVHDHVKIGDFGLATTALIAKQIPEEDFGVTPEPPASSLSVSQSVSVGDGRHTGRVGTLLYLSPEIKSGHGKTPYSQKVDIYSLGIIFFEMCYRPLMTMMERDRIIGSLRRPEIITPSDFTSEDNSQQMAVLRWVLNHDPSKRPSSSELLQSEYLPRMEEEKVHQLFKSMLGNPQTKDYKKIMSAIFSQPISRKFDFTYDNDIHKGINMSTLMCRQRVRQRLESVFTKHGAVQLDLPLMLPKLFMYESTDHNVTFMDHAGNLVSLPYDLRVPFARFASRNNIVRLKRYSISRVFRERKPHGIQPHEHYQCAFDIISPSQESLVPDAEVLSVIQEIVNKFPKLQARKYSIHMNHNQLMTAILLYCGLAIEQHDDVLTTLAEPRQADNHKPSAYSLLQSLSVNDQTASQICTFMDMSGSFSAISNYLRRITKSGQEAGSLAKMALHEMESLITYITALGVTMPVLVSLGFIYNIQNSSGVVYQIATEPPSMKPKAGLDVIAGGYRYDKLVSKFKRSASAKAEDRPAAVGMSILYDKLVSSVRQEDKKTSLFSVILFCIGTSSVVKEWLKLAQEFWTHGINTYILSGLSMDIEKVEAYCKESSVKYIVTLSDCDPGQAKLKCTDSAVEKKFSIANILDEVVNLLNKSFQQGDHSNAVPAVVSPQDKPDKGSDLHTFHNVLPISIILQHETKPSLKARNKTETAIHNHLNNKVLALLKKASEAEVVAFELGCSEVKALAAAFSDSDNEEQFDHNCSRAIQSQESAKNRKYMSKIVDRLRQVKFQMSKPPVVIIFGLKDNSYRVIIG